MALADADDASETPDEFEAWMEALDRALTEQFGPDHQAILSGGETVTQFVW